MANIGRRPTVNAGPESRLEVNLFDFSGDIYGTEITVALIAYIRPEIRFSGLDALKAQIAADAAEAYLRRRAKYAYCQLLLMRGMLHTRRFPVSAPEQAAELVRSLDHHLRIIKTIQRGPRATGRIPQVCSEFVYRCFWGGIAPAVDVPLLRNWPSAGPCFPEAVSPGDLWLTPSLETIGRLAI